MFDANTIPSYRVLFSIFFTGFCSRFCSRLVSVLLLVIYWFLIYSSWGFHFISFCGRLTVKWLVWITIATVAHISHVICSLFYLFFYFSLRYWAMFLNEAMFIFFVHNATYFFFFLTAHHFLRRFLSCLHQYLSTRLLRCVAPKEVLPC